MVVAQEANRGRLMPVVTLDLTQEMREIRARVRQQHRERDEQMQQEREQMQEWQASFLAGAPAVFETVPASSMCQAAPGGGSLDGYIRWFPPCVEIAKAYWWGSRA